MTQTHRHRHRHVHRHRHRHTHLVYDRRPSSESESAPPPATLPVPVAVNGAVKASTLRGSRGPSMDGTTTDDKILLVKLPVDVLGPMATVSSRTVAFNPAACAITRNTRQRATTTGTGNCHPQRAP